MSDAGLSPEAVRQWIAQGVQAEAQDWIERALQLRPSAEIWELQGDLWAKQARSDEAWEAYQAALLLEPERASVHAALAVLGLKTGVLHSARHHAEAARAFAPEEALYTRHLVSILLLQGERAEALLYVRELLQLEPEAASSFALLGQVMYLFGQRDLARQAVQQSLEIDPGQRDLHFLLMWWALGQRRWAEALRLGLAYPAHRSDAAQTALALHIWAYTLAAHGELAQARDMWQQALSLDFQAPYLLAYSLSAPLVYASSAQQWQWQQILEQAVDLLQRQREGLSDPYLWLSLPITPLPASVAEPAHQLWAACARAWQQQAQAEKTADVLEPESLSHAAPKRGVLLVSDLEDPACADWIYQWLNERQAPDWTWQVLYLFPGGLPTRFEAWASCFLQAPVHPLSLPAFVADLGADVLLYLQVDRELSHVLVQNQGPLQGCVPSLQIPAGLPFDFQLSGFSALACPRDAAQEAPRREDFDLPRLGHVYFIPAEPELWLPAWDSWLAEILRQDRKAFVYGLQRSGTALHSHVQQRLTESLGDRQHRVRWLDLSDDQRWQILPLVDGVLNLPGMDVAWLGFQALLQGVPVVDFAAPSQLSLCLQRAGLDRLSLSLDTEGIQRLCSWITQRTERVILSEALEEARPRLLGQADSVAALEQQVQTEWMRRNQHA
ncbi:MAG: hypothetical protein ACO1RX_01080 [Candidatus Sericytochromatia bacterium]